MTPEQLEDMQQFVSDFTRNVRTYKEIHNTEPYVADMLDDMDKLVTMRMTCIRESVEG